MLIIRPCRETDLDDLMHISHVVGKGMTSMPADEQAWMSKIEASAKAFNSQQEPEAVSTYFMVLEDSETGHLAGTTAIYTGVGLERPFYHYKVSTLVNSSSELDLMRQTRVLSLVNDYTGATEIGSLYLLPEYRKPGVGQFLSRARFLTIADFPDRFGQQVIAELRGWQDEDLQSPLWENLGKPFFGIEFQDAVNTAALKGSQFISDLMPKYPIYIDLLPQAAQEVIGKPHINSAPALHLLKKDGFQFNGYVDLFDGGPTVQSETQLIISVRDSCNTGYDVVDNLPTSTPEMIISNGCLDKHKLGLAPAVVQDNGRLAITEKTQQLLSLNDGGSLRYIPMRQSASMKAARSAA